MPLVYIVIGLAVAQFFYFGLSVGKARGKYNVPAPAMMGNEVFERYFRVQMNTLELLAMFIPSILLASLYVRPTITAALGALYLIGRMVYLYAYIKDPKSRGIGFGLSITPIAVLWTGGMVGAIRAALE